GTGVVLDHGRHVVECFGEALGRAVDDPRSASFLLTQLLLEEREQHDRADPGVGETPNPIEGVRERRRRSHEWIPQLQAHVAGPELQLHQQSLRASSGKLLALRVAISSYVCQRRSAACWARASSRSASAGSAFASAWKRSSPFL